MKEKIINDFVTQMKTELKNNETKGDWLSFAKKENQSMILCEIQYHLDKLIHAYENQNEEQIKEFSADIANISMFMFNSVNNNL